MLYFDYKIIQVDVANARPLWKFIYAYSAEGTKQRFLQKVFAFQEEQIYTAGDNTLWKRVDVLNAIKQLNNQDTRNTAISFFVNNLRQFALLLKNVISAEVELVDEVIKVNLNFVNEHNEKNNINFNISVEDLKKV